MVGPPLFSLLQCVAAFLFYVLALFVPHDEGNRTFVEEMYTNLPDPVQLHTKRWKFSEATFGRNHLFIYHRIPSSTRFSRPGLCSTEFLLMWVNTKSRVKNSSIWFELCSWETFKRCKLFKTWFQQQMSVQNPPCTKPRSKGGERGKIYPPLYDASPTVNLCRYYVESINLMSTSLFQTVFDLRRNNLYVLHLNVI